MTIGRRRGEGRGEGRKGGEEEEVTTYLHAACHGSCCTAAVHSLLVAAVAIDTGHTHSSAAVADHSQMTGVVGC